MITAAAPEAEFDVSGTPGRFCEHCEHAPCVAGGYRFCAMRPRFIVSAALKREIHALLPSGAENPLQFPLILAVDAVTAAARGHDMWADSALTDLAAIRDELRTATR